MDPEWPEVPLSDLYEYRSGLSKPRSAFGSGFPFLSFKDVFYNIFVPDDLTELVESSEHERRSCSVRRGDVFLTRTSETMEELGMACVALKDFESATFNGFCKRLRPKSHDQVIPEYAAYFFQSPHFRRNVTAMSSLSTRASLNNAMLDRLKLVLPPRSQQVGISAVLKALDDKIQLNRRMSQTLEEIARALFKSWFIDFDGHDELVASELGRIPGGWGVGTLGDSLSVVETGSRPKGGVAKFVTGVPSVGAQSIVGIGRFDFSQTKYVPRDFFDAMKRGVVEDRDVLVYKDGGRPGDFRPHISMFGDGFPFAEFSINSHVYRLRIAPPVSQEYLYFWLSSAPIMAEMRRRGTGAAIPGIPRRNLVSIPFLTPPDQVLGGFAALAAPVVSRILGNSSQSTTLAQLRDTLLPKLISGEVRVPEGEKAVEEAV